MTTSTYLLYGIAMSLKGDITTKHIAYMKVTKYLNIQIHY